MSFICWSEEMSNFSQVTRGSYYWSKSKLVALGIGVLCASYFSKHAEAMPFSVELIESQVICEECSPIALETVDGQLVTYTIPDADRSVVQAYWGGATDPIEVLRGESLFEQGSVEASGRFVISFDGRSIDLHSLDNPNQAISLSGLTSLPSLPNLLEDFSESELLFIPTAVNSAGIVAGIINRFQSAAIFDPATGTTENAAPIFTGTSQFLQTGTPLAFLPSDLNADASILTGGAFNAEGDFISPGYLSNGVEFAITDNPGFAYHIGSTSFDSNTILFEDENGVNSFFFLGSGQIGSFGPDFNILDTLSLGFLVQNISSGDCFIGDDTGSLTEEVGSNCVDALVEGNELLVLEEGSSIIRRSLLSPVTDEGSSEVPEPSTLALLTIATATLLKFGKRKV